MKGGTPHFAQEMEAMNVKPSVAKHKTERGGRRGVCPKP
jgi:hypothetical protein